MNLWNCTKSGHDNAIFEALFGIVLITIIGLGLGFCYAYVHATGI